MPQDTARRPNRTRSERGLAQPSVEAEVRGWAAAMTGEKSVGLVGARGLAPTLQLSVRIVGGYAIGPEGHPTG